MQTCRQRQVAVAVVEGLQRCSGTNRLSAKSELQSPLRHVPRPSLARSRPGWAPINSLRFSPYAPNHIRIASHHTRHTHPDNDDDTMKLVGKQIEKDGSVSAPRAAVRGPRATGGAGASAALLALSLSLRSLRSSSR